jgi:hypothetical protein
MDTMRLTIDIETIPCQDLARKTKIVCGITPPKNYKSDESIDKWWESTGNEKAKKAVEDTSLDGAYGEAWCIAWAINDGPIQSVTRTHLDDSEGVLLADWVSLLNQQLRDVHHHARRPTWVGHGVLGFDALFLHHRCLIKGIQPVFPGGIPYDERYYSEWIFDTMLEWTRSPHKYISLEDLAQAFGLEGKQGMTGADVWPAVQAGKWQEVLDYCKHDVELVRQIDKRMHYV